MADRGSVIITCVYRGGQCNMDKLAEDLKRIIKALESLNEHPTAASEPIDELLDQLFQQKTDLAAASINTTTTVYKQAVHQLAAATAKAERAAKNPSSAASLIPNVAQAIDGVAKLLDSVIT